LQGAISLSPIKVCRGNVVHLSDPAPVWWPLQMCERRARKTVATFESASAEDSAGDSLLGRG
jgi:hypothetical protein